MCGNQIVARKLRPGMCEVRLQFVLLNGYLFENWDYLVALLIASVEAEVDPVLAAVVLLEDGRTNGFGSTKNLAVLLYSSLTDFKDGTGWKEMWF